MKHLIVYVTFETQEQAQEIASHVVMARLAACANIFPPHESIYWWNDEIQQSQEVVGIFKTTQDCFEALKDRIISLHSYDVPCVVAMNIENGNKQFLDWIEAEITNIL